jgi:hypothetical protein
MIYLYGSRALNHWYPKQFSIKDNTDWDIITDEGFTTIRGTIDVSEHINYAMDVCEHYGSCTYLESPIGKVCVVTPPGLMLFKRSHLHRPIGFDKHIIHYNFLKKELGQQLNYYYSLLSCLTQATKDKYGDRTPSLNKSKKEFFDDYVSKVYDHDSIHYATCYGERPIYEELKTDNDKVWCSKDKWDKLSCELRIKCVREEAFTIAIERFLLVKKNYPPLFAFSKAVEKICTTLTSGWFRDFAIDNWPEVMDYGSYDFYGKFLANESSLALYSN